MQVHISPGYGRIRIATEGAHERIKRRSRVRLQQGVAQTRLADLTQGQVLTLVASVAEAQFPVPRLKVIAKFSHLTFESNIEDVIPVSELLTSDACVLNGTKPDSGSHRRCDTINNQSCVSDRERIKRVRDWDTDTGRAKAYAGSGYFKWIR